MSSAKDKYERIVDLAKRRGFFWQSFEIYGGVGGFYDLGPLGVLLKNNIVSLWREYFVLKHQDLVVEVETPVITPKRVFEASGHLEHFTDPIVECLKCGRKFRADHLIEANLSIKVEGLDPKEMSKIIKEKGLRCPECGGELSEVRLFNLLFQTYIGPYTQNTAFLRPEAAQGMFTSFKRVYEIMRKRLPLGIAQIGRVARNEISPRQGMVRLREFTIMEVEFFYDPEEPGEPPFERVQRNLYILTADERRRGGDKPEKFNVVEAIEEGVIKSRWLGYWMAVANDFVKELGLSGEEVFFEEKLPHEKAHYAVQTFDQMVKISRWGWVEVSGHAYRSDYDLSRHMKFSGQDMRVFRQYEKPVIKKVKKVVVDKAVIGRVFKDRAPEVLTLLKDLDLSRVKLSEMGGDTIKVGGLEIPKEAIKVVETAERVTGRHFIPHVAEPSFGAERLVLVALDRAYTEEGDRVVLKLPPRIAPIKVAVFPLLKREELVSVAKEIYRELRDSGELTVIYDDSGTIGRRYARADEIGVPYAVTVDYETLSNNTVTVRFRDSRKQVRIPMEKLRDHIIKFIRESRTG